MKVPIIEIKNLTKRFKKRVVLNNINLEVYKGEIFGLLGPNGAGKTVLINTLLGLIEPDGGKIKIFGQPLEKSLDWIHQKVNLASSQSQLHEYITIKDNLLTLAGLYGTKNPKEKIVQLTRFFGLERHLHQRTKVINLSSGEETRLILCKALLNNPQLLFLDEFTASLDPSMKKRVQNLILKIHAQRSLTIFYASHDLEEAKMLCRRIGFLRKGRLIKILYREEFKKLIKMY